MSIQQQLPILFLSANVLLLSACGGGGSSSPVAPIINDTTPPSITLKGNNPLFLDLSKPFVDPGALANDNQDGDISNKITQTNNINIASPACYIQEYKVADNSGNEKSIKRTVFVGNDQERHSPNHPPIAEDDAESTPFTQAITIKPLSNDTDIDCDNLTIASITQATIGLATLNPDNTISFDPQNNVGSFFFQYTLSDSHGGLATTGVSIASHDPNDGNDAWPDIVNDAVSTTINTALFIDVLANDSDDDGDTIILDLVDNPQHGTVTKDSGGVIYTPNQGYTGTDSFFYGAHDGHGHNGSAVVTVTITN